MLEVVSITGGAQLSGEVTVSGAKNASLPLLFATLLTSEKCELSNVPDLEDIAVTLRLIKSLGGKASFSNGKVEVRTEKLVSAVAPYSLVKALRASFWILGPLLARSGQAKVALPGGDAIGSRPVDLHLKGLSQMGAEINMRHGVIDASAPGGLHPAIVELDYPSVGATHNLLMAAALIPGETLIKGAAREPEVIQLAELLNSMGALVEGAGSPSICVQGQRELGGAKASILGDRIEAATYLTAGAMTGGRVKVNGIQKGMLHPTLQVLKQAGCSVLEEAQSVTVSAGERLQAVSFATAPYPGIPTDVQPLLMALMTKAEGVSRITETVFEARFGHVAEFRRLGADIKIEGSAASVKGVERLSAAPVQATDIRAAAGLVLMGLVCSGETELHEIYHLDRGYEALIDKFASLGARVRRVPAYEDNEIVLGC